jgi:hypothetical protein
MHPANVTEVQVNKASLYRFEQCLSSAVVDLKQCTDLVCKDAVLLAHVLHIATNRGTPKGAAVDDCIVLCGVKRLKDLCASLRDRLASSDNNFPRIFNATERRRRLVC